MELERGGTEGRGQRKRRDIEKGEGERQMCWKVERRGKGEERKREEERERE